MEVSGIAFRPLPCFSASSIDHAPVYSSPMRPSFPADLWLSSPSLDSRVCRQRPTESLSRKIFGLASAQFCDNGHQQYYCGPIRCGGGGKEKQKTKEKDTNPNKMMKKKMKLVKGLSRNLSNFSDVIGFGLDNHQGLADQVKGQMVWEAAELLLGQLQQLKAEKKELKKKKRRNEKEKAKLKVVQMQNRMNCEVSTSSSSCSSESSDGECGEVVDMSCLKTDQTFATRSTPNNVVNQEKELTLPINTAVTELAVQTRELQLVVVTQETATSSALPSTALTVGGGNAEISDQKCCSTGIGSFSDRNSSCLVNSGEWPWAEKKIEVCMGGKCKKSGAASLLEEFQKAVNGEGGGRGGSVVGCKCMGKCRDGPNVRVLNADTSSERSSIDDGDDDLNIRTPITNPLCIGVGLEDVGFIVSNYFFGGNQKSDLGMSQPAAAAAS